MHNISIAWTLLANLYFISFYFFPKFIYMAWKFPFLFSKLNDKVVFPNKNNLKSYEEKI